MTYAGKGFVDEIDGWHGTGGKIGRAYVRPGCVLEAREESGSLEGLGRRCAGVGIAVDGWAGEARARKAGGTER